MGVEILWLMPVHPIGIVKRKGSMGSYYAVKDHTAINPEFGTEADFKNLVIHAHSLGMKIILDWVANHTSWDHLWTLTNPSFYERNEDGGYKSPFDWDDVIQLDHTSKAQQQAMTDAMLYWVKNFGIDGFRADMAHLTPLLFWKNARTLMTALKKDLVWLAETETPVYSEVFDINYTWKWMHLTEDYCKDNVSFNALLNGLEEYKKVFDKDIVRMFFTSNHDENSWNGTEYEKYGDLTEALSVFSCMYTGIPLLYSGQELPNLKRLAFFENDCIEWTDKTGLHDFYKTLLHVRKTNPALSSSGRNNLLLLEDGFAKNIFAFTTGKDDDKIIVVINFGKYYSEQNYALANAEGTFRNIFTGETISIQDNLQIALNRGDYLVLEKIK